MLHIPRAIETQRFAVRTVVLEHGVGAYVVQQGADRGLFHVDVPWGHHAAGHAVGGWHDEPIFLRRADGVGNAFAGERGVVSRALERVVRQRAAAHEQRVLPVNQLPRNLRDDLAMRMDEIVGGLRLRAFAMQFVNLAECRNDSAHTHTLAPMPQIGIVCAHARLRKKGQIGAAKCLQLRRRDVKRDRFAQVNVPNYAGREPVERRARAGARQIAAGILALTHQRFRSNARGRRPCGSRRRSCDCCRGLSSLRPPAARNRCSRRRRPCARHPHR